VCRLFGLSGGPEALSAQFWLLQAPDSLRLQSHREPDGTGLGAFDEAGHPIVDKQPLAAYADREFAKQARTLKSHTFVAHIRYASTGGLLPQNTHPFEQHGRIFAHNGVITELPTLEAEVGEQMSLVKGDTDSERFFALITRYIDQGAEVADAITQAAGWIAAHCPVYALNIILINASDLWALRYPDTHDLFLLERDAGGHNGDQPLDHTGKPTEMRVRSTQLADQPSVVVASEAMSSDPGWQPLASGELLHVDGALKVTRTVVLPEPPARLLALSDLGAKAAASQAPSAPGQ
jgi:predicted glutamine amidotransferase